MSVVRGQSANKRLYILALPICQSLIVWSFRACGELWVRRVERLIGQNSFCGKQKCVHSVSSRSTKIHSGSHATREKRTEQAEWRWGGKENSWLWPKHLTLHSTHLQFALSALSFSGLWIKTTLKMSCWPFLNPVVSIVSSGDCSGLTEGSNF